MTPSDSGLPGRLAPARLATLAGQGVQVPAHLLRETAGPMQPPAQQPGVVHLGLGAFHRAHQALVFDTLLSQGDPRWQVFGVAMRQASLLQALAAQSWLYAVNIADRDGEHWRIGGALCGAALASQEPARVVAAIAAPGTRWVTLTVTEKGYGPALHGLLLDGLRARREAGGKGLTIASCDNLQRNGRRLEQQLLAAARLAEPALADWIALHVAFPDSMVDRIVPAATPALLTRAAQALRVRDEAALATEGFWEWVIEDRFADPTDAAVLAGAGVTVVPDVGPYETAKLRMLNASHSALACIGTLAGMATVSDAVGHAPLRGYLLDLMDLEVAPTLQRPDLVGYRESLLERFANPHLHHRLLQIASDSSQKIPQRWVPTIEASLQAGRLPQRLAFAAAAWMHLSLGRDAQGEPLPLSDPMAQPLQVLALQHAGDARASVQALGGLPAIWGTLLPQHGAWREAVAGHWQRIHDRGVLAALAALTAPDTPMAPMAPTAPTARPDASTGP